MISRSDARNEAIRELWYRGLAHEAVLDQGQRKWRADFLAAPPLSSTVWNIGRQRGKTFDAVFLALEFGATHKGAIIRYCAKTKDSAVSIVTPAWKQLTEAMPDEMRPVQGRTDYEWVFPSTGATFILFGTDAQSFTKGRGPRTDLQFLDECGFYQDLIAVESALRPSLQTTGGKALYLSTPADSVGHPYTLRIAAAKASGRYQHDTFWNNPRVDHEGVIEEERKLFGMTREEFLGCTYFRREYLAEVVSDASVAAMPAWNDALKERIVGDWPRPPHYDAYQAHDPGLDGDPHASLFSYLNPYDGRLYIDSELELRSAEFSAGQWAKGVQAKETELYGVTSWDGTLLGAEEWLKALEDVPDYLKAAISKDAPRQPYLRVGDDSQGICQDMTVDHKLAMMPTAKHNKALEVSNANQLLGVDDKVRIHSRCVRFIAQLYTTAWNKTRTEWVHTDTDHGDLIDDFVYICRNVSWNRDCRPKHLDSAQRHIAETNAINEGGWVRRRR